MHEKDLDLSLQDMRRQFEREGIPFALIGALAMQYHDFVRHTEDIDILTTREGLDRIHGRIVGLGIVPRFEGARKRLRDTVHKVDIDVIQAGENCGSNASPLVFPDPMSDDFEDRGGIRIPRLFKLVEFKLASGIWAPRMKDFGDVIELIKANGLEASFAERLHAAVRAKFVELVEAARKEREGEAEREREA